VLSNHEVALMVRDIMIYGIFFVLSAGLYAMFYALGKLFGRPGWTTFSYLFALGELLSAAGMIRAGYLDPFWVKLIAFSALVYLFIPQAMWWVVTRFHSELDEYVHDFGR